MRTVRDVAKFLDIEVPQNKGNYAGGYIIVNWHGLDITAGIYPTEATITSKGANPGYMTWLQDEIGYSGEVLFSPFPIKRDRLLAVERIQIEILEREEFPESVQQIVLAQGPEVNKFLNRYLKKENPVPLPWWITEDRIQGWKEYLELSSEFLRQHPRK